MSHLCSSQVLFLFSVELICLSTEYGFADHQRNRACVRIQRRIAGNDFPRGSDGRFGWRRFGAKLTPTPFGTHRALTHALPPSPGLRSVPLTVPPCFFPLPPK